MTFLDTDTVDLIDMSDLSDDEAERFRDRQMLEINGIVNDLLPAVVAYGQANAPQPAYVGVALMVLASTLLQEIGVSKDDVEDYFNLAVSYQVTDMGIN